MKISRKNHLVSIIGSSVKHDTYDLNNAQCTAHLLETSSDLAELF